MKLQGMVLAAGNGKRLHPLTLKTPKPLLNINNKPIIEYNLDLLKRYGVKDVYINSFYLSNVIKNYFENRQKDELNIHINIENKMMGSAGGVKEFQDMFNDTFVVISGDLLVNFNLEEMYRFHKNKKSSITMGLTSVEDPRQFGIVVLNDRNEIIRFQEKPKTIEESFSNLINTGIYIIEPYILDYIPKDTFFDFSMDLFPVLLEESVPFHGYYINNYWRDLGTIEQLKLAENDIIQGKFKKHSNY